MSNATAMRGGAANMLGFDPSDPGFRQNPYPYYRQLREQSPVFKSPAGFWVLTRHRECDAVLHDERFGYPQRAASPVEAALPGGFADQRHLLIFMNPPDHTRLRRVLRENFGPRVMRSATSYVENRTERLLDEALGSNAEFDLVSAVAHSLPFGVICHLLAVPEADHPTIEKWAQDYLAGVSPAFTVSQANHKARDEALIGLNEYFRALAEERRRNPGEDVLSRLVVAAGEDRLSEQELVGTCILLFIAGHGTTTNLIANGALALLRHPDQLTRFRTEPDLAAPAIEELLRYDSPSHLSMRTALADVDLGEGNLVREGEQVIVVRGAANRDPEVFPDPDKLDLGRQDNRHLSFAAGMHVCFGAPLARIQGRIALGTLFRRAPGLTLATEHLEYKPSLLSRALVALPVTVEG